MQKNFLRQELFFLTVILISSFLIRWHGINSLPYGIEGDEFSWTVTSLFHQYNIRSADKGIWSLHDANAQRFPVSIAVNQLAFTLFGTDFLSPRKMLVLISVASLLFFYLLARRFLSRKAALATLFLYSFSAYKLITSRIPLPGVFSGFFVYPALFFPLAVSPRKTVKFCVVLLLSGVFACLALLTYNLAYTIPVVVLVTIIFMLCKFKTGPVRWTLFLVFFTIPLLLLFGFWWKGIQQETHTKAYALKNSAFNLQERAFYPNLLLKNAKVIKKQIFEGLDYQTSDMLVSYPAPLVNRRVIVLFLAGLIFVLLQFRRYLPLLAWFLLGGVVYQLVLGLYAPRMWFVTLSVIYLIAGVAIDKVFKFSQKLFFPYQFTVWVFIVFFISQTALSEMSLYTEHALKNPTYLVLVREIVELTKKNKEVLGQSVTFVLPNKMSVSNPIYGVYAAASFYYLAEHPWRSELLEKQKRQDLQVLTVDEYKRSFQSSQLNREGDMTIVADKDTLPVLRKILVDYSLCLYSTKEREYFVEIKLEDCPVL